MGDDLLGHYVLQGENVLECPVEPICPQMVAGVTLDELARYTHSVGCSSYAAFQDITDTKFPAYLLDVDRLTFG